MRIDDLRECMELGSTLNFTSAAKNCFITQPALSKHVSNMESELGVRLFVRTKHGVDITPYGKIFLNAARQILFTYDAAIDDINRLKQGHGVILRVGMLTGAFHKTAAYVTGEFFRLCPNTSVHYVSCELGELLDAYDAEEIDLALIALPKSSHFINGEEHLWVPFADEGIRLMINKDHPLAKKESVTMAEIANYANAAPDQRMTGREIAEYYRILGIPQLKNVQYTVSSFTSVYYYVKAMNCVAVVMSHIQDYFGDPDLRFIPIEGTDEFLELGALWRKEQDSTAIRLFVDLFKKMMSKGWQNVLQASISDSEQDSFEPH